METKIVYFEKIGEKNTDEALAIAQKRAEELNIEKIVVASTRGITAAKAVNVFTGRKVIAVTHVYGAREANTLEFTDENREIVESKGGKVITAAHVFGGINQALQMGPKTPPPPGTVTRSRTIPEIIASTLGLFSRGMKVACEVSAMAVDSGLVNSGEEIIAIAGTHAGADTVIVLEAANSHHFFDAKIKEILCKPRT